jgi:hypothetical protein
MWNIIPESECGGSHRNTPVLVNNIVVLGKSLEDPSHSVQWVALMGESTLCELLYVADNWQQIMQVPQRSV